MSSEMSGEATILIVDDNMANLRILIRYLNGMGFETLIAQSGEGALRQLEYVMPDLILLDIMMPGIDGYETCRRLGENPNTKEIPVIFMSALSETIDKVKGFGVGAVDYITKPFQHEEVLARINTHLTIRKQKKQLKELNATKDKFFSIIAHDLRSPFNGLIGGTDFLVQSFDSLEKEVIRDLLKSMNTAARSAYDLLENLLEWSRSQTGRIAFAPEITNICDIVDENAELAKYGADEKQVRIKNRILKNTFAYADKEMINTVIRNLTGNALKYSLPGGEVGISAEEVGDFVEISVSDTGVGICDEDMEKLFRMDTHHTTPGTSEEQGTGLGLLLCKEFVEKNGGRIWVNSEFGKGATFRFTLPKSEKMPDSPIR